MSRGLKMAYPFYRASWWIVFILFKVLLRLKVEGQENIPLRGGIIFASNHASYLDPPTIGVSTKRELRFLAKRELFCYPIFRTIISKLNAIPIEREGVGKNALKTILSALRNGEAVLLFPEGTRSKTGMLGDAKAGVGLIASKTGRPVVPVYVSGTQRLWRTLLGLERLKVRFGKTIQFDGKVWDRDRKAQYRAIGRQVMYEIGALIP